MKDNVKFVSMDSANLDYDDESFDTVVDTFGLQASYDAKKQFSEMKRVCKKGGKILLLEFGESVWRTTNYRLIRGAVQEFDLRGQHLYKNWDKLILNDKDIKVLKSRRKINGRLYYYELEKI